MAKECGHSKDSSISKYFALQLGSSLPLYSVSSHGDYSLTCVLYKSVTVRICLPYLLGFHFSITPGNGHRIRREIEQIRSLDFILGLEEFGEGFFRHRKTIQ